MYSYVHIGDVSSSFQRIRTESKSFSFEHLCENEKDIFISFVLNFFSKVPVAVQN